MIYFLKTSLCIVLALGVSAIVIPHTSEAQSESVELNLYTTIGLGSDFGPGFILSAQIRNHGPNFVELRFLNSLERLPILVGKKPIEHDADLGLLFGRMFRVKGDSRLGVGFGPAITRIVRRGNLIKEGGYYNPTLYRKAVRNTAGIAFRIGFEFEDSRDKRKIVVMIGANINRVDSFWTPSIGLVF